ncbi:MAG TPA: chromosome segregation SMC family protein [Candidatus Lokiarchaeia archaeon]|nr:chromosome segregation SMC family protein [Candidatus Lokiarchaeia archaeon]
MGSTFIKEIVFNGFKSFGDQKVTIKLDKGFTAIIGPNGSGKSNIIDGLCFALGRLSKKTMRAENLKDLIFVGTKTKKPADSAEVQVVFDNSENIFPGYTGQDLTISREITQKNKSTYRLNGARCTREEILMKLALANVDPDGFNFILQGKIVELTHISPEDRRIFIEELVGLQKFDTEKAAALKELEKADQDLVKFEAIFQEVARQLKAVEKEKNDALRWLELDKKIKELNARLIAINIKKLRDEEEQVNLFISETNKKIEEINEEIASTQDAVDKENDEMNDLTAKIEALETKRNDLETQVSNMRSELSSKKTELNFLTENLEKMEERKSGLEEKQEALEEGTTYDQLLAEVQEEIDGMNIQIAKTRSEIQDRENQVTKLESELTIFQQELNAFNKRLNTASSSKSSLETELKMTKDRLVKLESKKTSLEKELSKLLKDKDEDIAEAMAATEQEAKDLQATIDGVKLELKKETQKQKSFETEIEKLRGQLGKFDTQINDSKSKIQVAKTEQEYFEKQINSLKHDAKTLELNQANFNGEIERINKELEKTSESFDAKNNILADLKSERDEIEKSIDNSQKEYEGVEEEIFSVMSNLEMLTDDYKTGVGEVSADVQASGMDTVENSMTDFKGYINDLVSIIETIKTLQKEANEEDLDSAYKNLDMFLENYDESMRILKDDIQKNIGDLVKNNTSNFTNFIQDLMDIISQVHISLRKLKMTRNTEQINALHEIDKKKSELLDDISSVSVTKTKLEGELKQSNLELRNIESKQKSSDAQVEELTTSIETKNAAIEEFQQKIDSVTEEKSGLQEKIDEKTKEKEEFWETSNRLNQEIEENTNQLQVVQDKLRGLQTVQKLIKDIEEHEAEITESNEKIAADDEKIQVLDQEINEIEANKVEKEKDIQDLKRQKEDLLQEQKDLRTRQEEESKDLQSKQKRQAALSAMIAREKEIAQISEEMDGINAQLEEGNAKIEEFNESIKGIEEEKSGVVAEIAELNGKKQSVWERQKELQEELSKLNTSLGNNNNKLSNFQNRKTEISQKIEELYEQSKEFGALPEVLEGWTETAIKGEIGEAAEEKKTLEPVNLKSIEQYDIVKNRFDDIDLRRQSLQRERKAILENIEKIELEKTRQFMRAFNEINLHFSEVFMKLSPGGIAKMILENPAKPFEGGLVIEARPRGKKITSIESLSGGEKTLVALSFIFAVERFQPAPFYVMDEIDAALDGPNVHRVSMVIKEFGESSQFIVISHREENIVNADKIYGVSMRDSITDIFSIKMDEMEPTEAEASGEKSMDELIQDEDDGEKTK